MPEMPTIYVKPGCPYCEQQRERFRGQGIEWTEIDATQSPEDRAELMRLSNGTGLVPTVVEGDNVTIGIDGKG